MRGTQTEKNLLKAFVGESQARNRYLFYAKLARKEGYEEVGAVFEQTAEHELSHSKNFFKYLNTDERIEIQVTFPGGRLATTIEHLRQSIKSEHEEWSNQYKEYAEIASEEGFPEVAALFRNIGIAEAFHEERFNEILSRLESGEWYSSDHVVKWMCRKCGYIHVGNKAPQVCPACMHPQSYFEIYDSHF